eukprot:TRINITY_DN778_c0_g1_i6.p1 TRINITY_DN778_c0_g1~~TRINITY_DN778_c0_g1_i6.p1  ORF type:complete len:225 (-),score=18.25 TRINITY_DN778_c0_g1_i6:259-933(-)
MSGASVLAGEPETKSRANGGVRITDVFVNWYHPTGHGITIHVHGSKEVAMVTPKKLFVTVMGDIWNTIPGPIAFIARSSFLPLELNSSYCNIEDSNNFLAGGNGQLTINIGNKENGTFGVLHATISFRLSLISSPDLVSFAIYYSTIYQKMRAILALMLFQIMVRRFSSFTNILILSFLDFFSSPSYLVVSRKVEWPILFALFILFVLLVVVSRPSVLTYRNLL